MINHWTDIKTGDRLFKDTDFNDKGKSLFMKCINWFTSMFQGFKKETRGNFTDGADHTETFVWVNDILYVASATNKEGVRRKPFKRWCNQEGNPRIVIIRKTIPYTKLGENLIRYQIEEDMGLPYALKSGTKALLTDKDEVSIADVLKVLEERGLICSETTAKWEIKSEGIHWPDMLPKELQKYYLENGRHIVFDGKCLNLFKL